MRYLIVLLMCLPVMGANTWWVWNGADGTGADEAHPTSVTDVKTKYGNGDTVYFLDGAYTGGFSLGQGKTNILFKAKNKWGVVITNGSPGIALYNETACWHTLDGFRVTNSPQSGIFIATGSLSNAVRNCWSSYNGTSSDMNGIEGHDLLYVTIENNLCEHNGTAAAHGHGIYVSGTNVVIRNNVGRYNGGAGAQIYRSNDAPPGGNPNGGTQNAEIYNNLFYGNGRFALAVGSKFGFTYQIFNNTLIHTNSIDGLLFVNDSLGSQDAIAYITNNIFGTNLTSKFLTGIYTGKVFGINNITNNVDAFDFGFANRNRGLYWLSNTSPCRNIAATKLPPVDFFGRTQTNVLDLGAFQYTVGKAYDTRTLDPSGTPNYWQKLGWIFDFNRYPFPTEHKMGGFFCIAPNLAILRIGTPWTITTTNFPMADANSVCMGIIVDSGSASNTFIVDTDYDVDDTAFFNTNAGPYYLLVYNYNGPTLVNYYRTFFKKPPAAYIVGDQFVDPIGAKIFRAPSRLGNSRL